MDGIHEGIIMELCFPIHTHGMADGDKYYEKKNKMGEVESFEVMGEAVFAP